MMLLRNTLKYIAIGIAVPGCLCLGTYLADQSTHIPSHLAEQIPLLRGTVQLTDQVGSNLVSTGENLEEFAKGLIHTGQQALSGVFWQKKQQQLYHQYPALEEGTHFALETSKNVVDSGKNLSKLVGETFFPDIPMKERQARANEEIAQLNHQLAEKQSEIQSLARQADAIKGQVHSLQKVATPLKSLIPDGFNFMALPNNVPGVGILGHSPQAGGYPQQPDSLILQHPPGDTSSTFPLTTHKTACICP